MIISIIAAMDQNRGIGIDNKMPWHLPADLKRFKRITMGHHLILGRKTYQSIGKKLPGRKMIVLSRNPDFLPEYAEKCASLEEALKLAQSADEKEIFIIGGGQVYQEALPLAQRLYLSFVQTKAEADTYFPQLELSNWSLICEQEVSADEDNPLGHTFKQLVRKP
jgi:dihydrofolate reductase